MTRIEKMIVWCDKAMVFSFYALIYFLPISIALSEIFTGAAFLFWLLKRGVVFYQNLAEENLENPAVSALKILRIFLRSFKPVTNYLNTPIAVFLLFSLISVLASQFRAVSFVGFLGKSLQGAFIYFNFIECMNSKKRLKIFLNVLLISSFLICVNGIYQYYFGQGFIRGHIFEGRISSSLRQANDLGAYLVIVSMILLGVLHFNIAQIFHCKKHNKNRLFLDRLFLHSTYFAIYSLLFILTLTCLGLTYSRGAWISLGIAALSLGFWRKRIMLINAFIIILFLGVFYPQLHEQRNMGLIQAVSVKSQDNKSGEPLGALEITKKLITRVTTKQELKEEEIDTEKITQVTSVPQLEEPFSRILWKKILKTVKKIETSGRFTYWQEAFRMIKHHPIFGVGINTYSLAAPEYKISWGGYPHNCYLQMLAEIGIFGFLCFLWILYRLFRNGIKKFKRLSDPFCKMLLGGSMAAFGGFLFHSFFDTFFYSVQLGSFMWIMMGLIVSVQNVEGDEGNNCETARDYKFKFIRIRKEIAHVIIIILIFYIFLSFSIKRRILNPKYARVFYNQGVQCGVQAGCSSQERLELMNRAIYYNPNLSDAYFQLGETYRVLGNNEKAIEHYRRATELDHTNWKAYFEIGYHYFVEGEPDYALRYLKQAFRKNNYSDDVNYYIGLVYEERKDYKAAISYYKIIMDPKAQRYKKARVRMGALYHILGQTDKAFQKNAELRNKGWHNLADQLERFIATGEYPEFMRNTD